jgi:hypothetical protein
MAKDFGLSCPLCLVANDPADMLGVVIEHAIPVPSALVALCKRCVLAIVKTAMATELISPEEVFVDAPAPAESLDDRDVADPSIGAAAAAVSTAEPDGEGAGEHRPEPEIPAGGAEPGTAAELKHTARRVRAKGGTA